MKSDWGTFVLLYARKWVLLKQKLTFHVSPKQNELIQFFFFTYGEFNTFMLYSAFYVTFLLNIDKKWVKIVPQSILLWLTNAINVKNIIIRCLQARKWLINIFDELKLHWQVMKVVSIKVICCFYILVIKNWWKQKKKKIEVVFGEGGCWC